MVHIFFWGILQEMRPVTSHHVYIWSLLVTLCLIAMVLGYMRTRHFQSCGFVPIPSKFDVYFINLQTAPKRLAKFMKRYKATDLYETHSPIRFEAVNGKEVPLSKYVTTKALRQILQSERRQYRTLHYELTRGAIGCFLSHRGVWQRLLESDAPAALVLEDDTIISPDIGHVLDNIFIPSDTDILLLGYFCNKCSRTPCGVSRVRKFFGLHAYLITRQGAETLLRQPELYNIGKQIDALLGEFARRGVVNIYATRKQHVVQDPGFRTSIQMVLKEKQGIDPWDETR